MNYKVNGRKFSSGQAALDEIKKVKRITGVTVPLGGRIGPRSENSDEGFRINRSMIAEMSIEMKRMNATYARITMSDCPAIQGRTLMLIMVDPKHHSWWRKPVIAFLEKLV